MNEPAPDEDSQNLKYTGNAVPRVIRFAWTVLFGFMAWYLYAFFLPDLGQWVARWQQR